MAEKKGKQHQLLAVLPSLQGAASKILGETVKTFREKHGLFIGILKTYKPLEEEGDDMPAEGNPEVATTVGEKLKHLGEVFGPFIDAAFQIDMTNMQAVGTIDIDGVKIEGVPATFLMQLDKRLGEIRQAYDSIPTLDPKRPWMADADQGKGVFKSTPEQSFRTQKKLRTLVKYEATEHHPAQTEVYNEDIRVGEWTTLHWSGMITPQQKFELIARIDKLQRAVKVALSQANETVHATQKIADKLFSYINGELPMSRG